LGSFFRGNSFLATGLLVEPLSDVAFNDDLTVLKSAPSFLASCRPGSGSVDPFERGFGLFRELFVESSARDIVAGSTKPGVISLGDSARGHDVRLRKRLSAKWRRFGRNLRRIACQRSTIHEIFMHRNSKP
jgi:hypothetical protein